MNWKNHKIKTESYINEDQDLVIIIIKTGFPNIYIVTYDDPYQDMMGTIKLMRKEDIYKEYGIRIQI